LSQPNLSLAELPDDLLRREILSSVHLIPSLELHHPEILSLKVAMYFRNGLAADERLVSRGGKARIAGT